MNSFSLFSPFQQLTGYMFIIKFWQGLDLNCGPQVSEDTALLTETQQMPSTLLDCMPLGTLKSLFYRLFLVFSNKDYNILEQKNDKMSIQYPVLVFKPMTLVR